MHDLISRSSRSLLSGLLLVLMSTAMPGCAKQVRVPSENFNSRVSVVVIHHTTENFAESLQTLTRRSEYPVSSHYLIPEPDDPTYDEGELRVYELVPETYRAWHAGESYWGGRTSLNDQSIGIELVNRTHCHRSAVETGNGIVEGDDAPGQGAIDESTAIPDTPPASICFYPDFAESQIEVLAELLGDILRRHPSIKPTQVVGHSDIAPDRKVDPGPRFPWQRLYRLGFGAWYDDATVIRYWERFRLQPLPLRNVQRALRVYGYDAEASGKLDVQTRNVLRAFQMHFRPSQTYGRITTETVATLFALIEKYYPEHLDELLRADAGCGDLSRKTMKGERCLRGRYNALYPCVKLTLRRIGNSLGVILPRPVLDRWGLREGDTLELTERGIRPPANPGLSHERLDQHKRALALAVVRRFTPPEIRAQSLANLHRWRKQGAWVSAYAEWQEIIERGDDGELFAAMLGNDECGNRLRQSPPYVGLLPRDEVRKLNEEAAA